MYSNHNKEVNKDGEVTESDKLLLYINDNFKELREIPVDERNNYVNDMLERFFDEEGEYPSQVVLNRLSDLILYDHMEGDSRQHKMQQEDAPILTQAQYDRRVKGKSQKRKGAYVEAPLGDFSFVQNDAININLDVLNDLEKEID